MHCGTRGRYVRLLIGKLQYTFVDEIEIYRGREEWLTQPPAGNQVSDMNAAGLEAQGVNARLERLRGDLAEATGAISGSRLTEEEQKRLLATAAGSGQRDRGPARRAATGLSAPSCPSRTCKLACSRCTPPSAAPRGIPLSWPGRVIAGTPLLPVEAPAVPPPAPPRLVVRMMAGEHRAEVLNLTNSGDVPLKLAVNLRGLPGGANPDYVGVHEVLFTDTYVRRPIAAALPPAKRTAAGYEVALPAGMTRQVWFDFHPRSGAPSPARGAIEVTAAGQAALRVPLQLRVSSVTFPERPSVAVGGWDYSDADKSAFDAAGVDQQAFLAKLQEYGVDTPWGTHPPAGAKFDAAGAMDGAAELRFLDAWVAQVAAGAALRRVRPRRGLRRGGTGQCPHEADGP